MTALKTARAWYAARSPLAKIGIAGAAFVLVLVPFVGDDTEAASADDAPTPTATVTATATATTTVTATVTPEDEAEPTKQAEADAEPSTTPEAESSTPKPPADPRRTRTVSRVVDGDTVELANGETVRVVGIDTPERGECGYAEASAHMERLVLGKRVRLGESDEDRDGYGRLLRYVDVGNVDAGLRQIKAGLAIARYDSRDGYGYHPREDRYVAADNTTPDISCDESAPEPAPSKSSGGSSGGGSGATYFENCTAARDAGAAPVRKRDPGYGGHLDRDGDGVGCE